MKRRLSSHTPSRAHPPNKRMAVPSSEEDALENVYEWDWNRFLEDTTLHRIPRPFPSSTVLTSLVPASQGIDMPLLQHLKPLMRGYSKEGTDNDNTTTAKENIVVNAIDDASLSTLTKGQHARYLQLESGSESWNEGRRKEFRKLSQRVHQEQELYQQALQQFWEQHKDQFKVGLVPRRNEGVRYQTARATV